MAIKFNSDPRESDGHSFFLSPTFWSSSPKTIKNRSYNGLATNMAAFPTRTGNHQNCQTEWSILGPFVISLNTFHFFFFSLSIFHFLTILFFLIIYFLHEILWTKILTLIKWNFISEMIFENKVKQSWKICFWSCYFIFNVTIVIMWEKNCNLCWTSCNLIKSKIWLSGTVANDFST